MSNLSMALLILVSLYCAVEAFREYRRRSYVLAALGAACVVVLWTTPIQTHAVKLDLPISMQR